MDIAAVKVLLESQERTFKTALDIVIEELKSRIQLAEGTLTEVIKSLKFSQSEVKDLQGEVKVLRTADSENKTLMEDLKQRTAVLENRVNYQEAYSPWKNISISGMEEKPGGES